MHKSVSNRDGEYIIMSIIFVCSMYNDVHKSENKHSTDVTVSIKTDRVYGMQNLRTKNLFNYCPVWTIDVLLH